MAAGTADTARLFFAAWPAPEVQHALHKIGQQAQRQCGGRAIPERNIHLTLVFLGNVERVRLPQLKALAAGIVAAPCGLTVDRVGYWRHNRILWAGLESCPASLLALVSILSGGLRAIGFDTDSRPYLPHVTLLRDARRAPLGSRVAEIAWPLHDFSLIESVERGQGRVYEVLRRWQLANV